LSFNRAQQPEDGRMNPTVGKDTDGRGGAMEQALRESEQRLALALEAADLGTWERDLASNRVRLSPRQAELLGYPRTVREATYDMWRCRVHPQDVAGVEQRVQAALRACEGYHCEYRVVWPDGSIHWVEGHGGILTDEAGRPTRTIGTARDVTERKLLELELRQARDELDSRVARATEELRQSERQYRLLAEHGTDMISRISPEGIYRYASPACRTLLGYEPEEMVGRVGIELVHPEDHPLAEQTRKSIISGEEIYTITCRCVRKDGSLVWVEATCRSVRDPQTGEVVEIIAASRDVSERKRAEARAQQLLAELSRVARLTTVGAVASGLAHELNQPLFAISNYAGAAVNLLRSGKVEPAALLDFLSKAAVQARAAADIVRRVRSFVAHHEPRLSTVELNAIVREAVSLSQSWWEGRPVAVRLDLAAGLPLLQLDRILIQQVLVNLIRNAQEAMAEMPVEEQRIAISTSRLDAGQVAVTVRDNGPGLPPHIAAHLFEVFQSTKPRGLGLGLTISRSIVEAHHGRLIAESGGQQGTTFRFTLPIGS
jgi:two-component system sensor kinase FixL